MSDTRPDELVHFLELLTEDAPADYEPWLFRVEAGSKAPDLSFGSWKDDDARMSQDEAVRWMQNGGNVGIAGRPEDRLVNVDIDDEDETTPADLKDTLIARSRSRTGIHAWYFEADDADVPNIPTDDAGEVRANWQYVVAPGSYVETDADAVPDGERADAGYYTVEAEEPVATLTVDELPDVFQRETRDEADVEVEGIASQTLSEATPDDDDGDAAVDRDSDSALFDVTAGDVAHKEGGSTAASDRWAALFHDSDTGMNMSFSEKGLLQCWRHEVAHNGLQALCVLSDYSAGCKKVGSPHRESGASQSCLKSEDGAHIWHAWKYAKQNGYIPDDDPVPYAALIHLCRTRDLCPLTDLPDDRAEDSIPGYAYDAALSSIEGHDELNPGRKKTDEFVDDEATPDAFLDDDVVTDADTDGDEKGSPNGGTTTDSDDADTPDDDRRHPWSDVRNLYEQADVKSSGVSDGMARQAAEEALLEETAFMCVTESDNLWVYDEQTGTYNGHGEAYIGSKLKTELGSFYAVSEKTEIIDRIKEGNRILRRELNARQEDGKFLCVGNGVVDFKTGELYDHDPEYRFVRGLDVDFPTPANGLDADKGAILDFLDDITQRQADRDTLLDHLAHGLMPGHPYRAFIVAFGPGGNGKTQLSQLFTEFVGDDNSAAVEIDEMVNDDFATGDLPGKFLNWGDDMSGDGGGQLDDLSTLKKASGGSNIRANEKYEKTFDFKNEAALFFSANEPPRFGEEKPSIKDRLYPIEMPYRFVSDPDPDDPMKKEKTPKVADLLLEDDAAMRGLLQLAVEHGRELIENRGQYSMPETPDERFEIYNQEADPIVSFARTVVKPANGGMKIRKDDAYRVYQSVMTAWQDRAASERGFKRQFPSTVAADVEDARSRQLATPDDEKDRVRCWKRLTWTAEAKEFMPDWMQARYNDHFDDTVASENDEAEDISEDTPPLAARDLGRGQTLTAEVTAVSDGEYSREAQGILEGPHGTVVGFVIPGGNQNVLEGRQGRTIELDNVTMRTDEDGLREVVINDATTVTAAPDDERGNDSDDDDGRPSPGTPTGADSTATATDGGNGTEAADATDGVTPADVTHTVRLIEQTQADPVDREVIVDELTSDDAPPSAVRHAIDKALTEGRIQEPRQSHYRVV
jgi:P4 family phage/plasmid primase-like protien